MKHFVTSLVLYLFHTALPGQAPTTNVINNNAVIYITTNKTSSLIFPNNIRYIDRGTGDVLVQQVTNAENILLVKAGIQRFKETNITVIANDGNVYSFIVKYDSVPLNSIYYVANEISYKPVLFNHETLSPADIATYANAIVHYPKRLHKLKTERWGIRLSVNGIYIKDDVLFFQFNIRNRSRINYDIDLVKFYIKDALKAKRTATQELEQQPLFITDNIKTIKASGKAEAVAALPKFTIPDHKYLALQIMEKNGGRHLLLKIGNRTIIKAKKLSDLDLNKLSQ